MPMKINVGVNKKVGLPDYGSAGSHCNIELEMDFSVIQNPEEFHKRVQYAYQLCRESVEGELAFYRSSDQRERVVGNGAVAPIAVQRATLTPKTEYRNSPPPERNENRFPISSKQLNFIAQLTKAVKGLSAQKLDDYCQRTFGRTCNQLSAKEGSQLIDALKDAKAGKELV